MIIKSITTFLLVYFCFLASAVAGGKTMPPSSVDNVLPLSNIQQIILPGIDNDKVQAEDIQRKSEGLAPRYAIPVPCDYTPLDSGTWETMGNGKRLWRLRVRSEGATSLNFGFTQYFMPEGGELYVYSTDRSSMRGPYTDRDNEVHGELWTPVVLGDSAVIELVIPSEVTDLLKLRLTSINHGYGEYFVPDKIKSGTCNVDVVCSEGNNWRDEIRSVGVISTDGSLFCSGFMVNNTAEDFTPYFMTANHCGITSGNAASLVVYWNFETTSCGGSPNGTLDDNQTGAIFRAARATSDFTLVELDDAPDPTFNVYWAGWDNSNADPTRAVGIHHPNTDEKRISFENNALNTTGYLGDAFGDGSHLKVIDWDIGTTEPGSSGSGLWNQNHHIVGQLHGGYAACGNDLADWYGRFSVSWDVGSSSSTRLRDWLDPGNTGTVTLDGIDGSTTPICPTLPSNGIMDNGSQWTSKTGTWNSSSGVNPYGGGSLYSNTSGTYEYCATGVSGSKEVSLWWTEYSSRCTSVQVGIYDGNTSIDTVYVNHKADGGKWNLLGTYTFSGKAKVVINSGGGCTTSADACKISAAGTGGCFADPKFQIGTCNNGNQYYTDRSYTLTDVGPFAGMDMIKTLNDDRNNTMSSDYLKFTTNLSGWVYVAYDRRATTPPNWLTSTFTKIDCKIYTSLSSQGWLDVYKRAVSYGECVDLGANKGPGFSGGTVSNYIVLESSTNVGDQCGGGGGECELDPKFVHGNLTNGVKYYTDRDYRITDAGPFAGLSMIKTPNADRNSTMSSGYLNLELIYGDPVTIYVAYDRRASSPPNWLTSRFTKIGCAKIQTSLSSQGWLDVYWTYLWGGECMSLGGNKGPGFSGGTVSNYIVFESYRNPPNDYCDGGGCGALSSRFKMEMYQNGLVEQTYYTDRDYYITYDSLLNPSLDIIKTPNNDRNNSRASGYMRYENGPDLLFLYVAFDSRLTSLPDWASGFVKYDGWVIHTSLSSQPYMQVYQKTVEPYGCIDLGGNKASGASAGTASNYIVFRYECWECGEP